MEDVIINHWAVLTCAILNLVLGALWYSPILFYKAWIRESALTEAELEKGNKGKIYGLGFLLAYIMSYNMAFFLGDVNTLWQWGITAGFLTGIGWAGAVFTVIALFELKSWKYILIHGGYIIVYFTLIGYIISAWR